MKTFSNMAIAVFEQAINDYKQIGRNVYATIKNPFKSGTIEHDLYRKNWIDNIQWSLEDIIRDPDIDPQKALDIKRWIDRSNQERTDTVEDIDTYFRNIYKDVTPKSTAKINTESPAWAIDRLSILMLKITYMSEAAQNSNNSEEVRVKSARKLETLLEQREDLSIAIDELLIDISNGDKYMKVYRQMKMYNDPELNPLLKGQKI